MPNLQLRQGSVYLAWLDDDLNLVFLDREKATAWLDQARRVVVDRVPRIEERQAA